MPLEKIRGFRGPFLLHNERQREVLQASGFLYDSTITSVRAVHAAEQAQNCQSDDACVGLPNCVSVHPVQTWGPGSFSPDGAHNVWPFTQDYGIPIVSQFHPAACLTQPAHPFACLPLAVPSPHVSQNFVLAACNAGLHDRDRTVQYL